MDKPTFNQFAQQWREGYEGPENAGKTAFIRGGEATFKAVGATLKDVDQKITREMAKQDVLMMLEVPKEILGMTDGGALGRSTVEAFTYVFARETIEPIMKRLDRIYETILLGQSLNDGAMEIEHESPIPDDKEYQLARQEKGTNVWMTVNEARAIDGLPPIDGGDELQPKNTVPIAPVAGKSIQTAKKTLVLKKKPSASEQAKLSHDKKEQFRKDLVETNDVYAKKLKTALSKFASGQLDRVISSINATKKAYEEWLFHVKDEAELMAEVVTPVILDLMDAQAQDVTNFISGEVLVMPPEVIKKVESNILKLSADYNLETYKKLEKIIAKGVENGDSLVKIKKSIESEYTNIKGYRAERIARTETLRSSNETAEYVYKYNGFSSVQWFTNPGACEFCQTYEGQVKSIGSTYTQIGDVVTGADGGQMSITYDNIDTPPLHPNCTCSLVPAD
jgi:gas vesicle protein